MGNCIRKMCKDGYEHPSVILLEDDVFSDNDNCVIHPYDFQGESVYYSIDNYIDKQKF